MPGRPVRRAEIVLSLGVLALGVVAAIVAFRLPEAGGYARIGPNFVPKLVAGALIAMGLWLLAEVATGGWRDAALGIVLGLAVYLFFVRFLNVSLPAGWLAPVLGVAGL